MINYTIVVPHKNSPDLLKRCLNSIPPRDDVKVVVVDDNSSDVDAVKNVVSDYGHAHLILATEGLGAGHCRNVGVENAEGRWILFSDADDFFHEGFLDVCDKYIESDNDIVFFDVDCCYSETLEPAPSRNKTINPGIKSGNLEHLKWLVMPVWSKLFSLKLVKGNNIKFDEVISSNDVMFTYQCSHYAQKCSIDKFVIYCNTVNYNSLCYKINIKNIESRIGVRIRANKYLKDIGKNEYHGNLFSLYLYYKDLGAGLFFKKFIEYLRVSSIEFIYMDLKISVKHFLKKKINGEKSGRSSQKITR